MNSVAHIEHLRSEQGGAVSDEQKVPKLGDRVRQFIYDRFGLRGLVGLGLVAVVFFVWTHNGALLRLGQVFPLSLRI
ncbi:MAG: hypothetical protein ACHBNF_18150 [Chromatiales bacterium]